MKANNEIDPLDPLYLNVPLWCVYGYDCFPKIIACALTYNGAVNIWGYSVYRRQPGYRTLGQNVVTWMKGHQMVKFFAKQEDAIMFINKLVTPKCDVNGDKL